MIEAALMWAIGLMCTAGVVAMVCRIHHMSRDTKIEVGIQHVILGGGFFAVPIVMWLVRMHYEQQAMLAGRDVDPALIVCAGGAYGLAVFMGSVVAYLMLGSARWRFGAPAGTYKPQYFDSVQSSGSVM